MHRIDSSGALASLPAPASPGATAGYFTGGNPGLGQAATIVSADWLNAVQEELLGGHDGRRRRAEQDDAQPAAHVA